MSKILMGAGMVFITLIFSAVLGFLFGWFVMLLWNCLMPEIFGLSAITYWQGVGLYLLSAILVKATATTSSKSKE